ncbi:MAG: hypothetical protein ACOY0S_02270, partial [Patescibacteria group bacterium]
MVEVIPGILEKDWSEIETKLKLASPHVDWVQIDVADNTLVPNETFLDFSQFASLTKKSLSTNLSRISLEAHLMVDRPDKYIRPLVDAGFKRLIAHLEANDPRRFLDEARYESIEVGVAIDGPTDFVEIEPFLEEVDCVLVMMYEAGFSGQPFQPENLEKIKIIRRNLPDLPIEVEGGISEVTARLVKDAGATRLVSTSYI